MLVSKAPEGVVRDGEVQSARVVGYGMPARESDCTGLRPSWYPFAVNVCDLDAPDPLPLTARQKTIS